MSPRRSPLTLTTAALSALGVLLVFVDDSWRTGLLAALAILIIYATRWRAAPITAAILAPALGALALTGHAAAHDTRPLPAAPARRHVAHPRHHAQPRGTRPG